MINSHIKTRLSRIEEEENVTILYACESGSRAWGFESADSDYDVRFIYLRRTPWYLTIEQGRDVIERPLDEHDTDMSGWDLLKALELFRRSNPPLLEWLQSPIVYRVNSSAIDQLRHAIPQYYSPVASMYHYMHMATGNFREYLKNDEVWTKKYFYVLRPVLAAMWIERDLGAPPTEFAKLVDAILPAGKVRREIDALVAAKKAGQELRKGPRNEIISTFLMEQIERLDGKGMRPSETRDPAGLDRIFMDILVEVNGNGIRQEEGSSETVYQNNVSLSG
ncbi:MAG: nucleotidyltransferase domain-containing protein [Syntrophorhabdaceae bacterium]|jgi:hypothetical protein